MKQFFGKYRGKVVNNVDPQQMGRLQVSVPAVLGEGQLSWAMPCMPFAGQQSGVYMVPTIGANVWVEFEGGDPDYPIWTGGFWGVGETPALALAGVPASPNIVLQTSGQNAIVISDTPGPTGGIMLKSATGATITVNDVGITIQNGKGASVTLTGPTTNLNNGALTIT